ncbi:helix-turn-helix domain-containing protein [Pyruvatibacter mobilis]|uniref:helix-turn-helix domain-containing protein n=1 Tax=Pyruvatibacter mobilis TaxID=1712261 RepID=UPI003BAA3047
MYRETEPSTERRDIVPTPLGERVRELRQKRDLTLEGLAERVGSSKSYMWEIENKDVARPSAEKLAHIATALETTVEYLLVGDGEQEEEDAEDTAFYRKYRKLDAPVKERMRKMLDILDDE